MFENLVTSAVAMDVVEEDVDDTNGRRCVGDDNAMRIFCSGQHGKRRCRITLMDVVVLLAVVVIMALSLLLLLLVLVLWMESYKRDRDLLT
jgi:hypothetical protein